MRSVGNRHGNSLEVKKWHREVAFFEEAFNYKYYQTSYARKMKFFKKIKNKIKAILAKSPYYVKFLRFRDKVTGGILKALLAFFNLISPIWNFFFVKAPDFGVGEELRKM